LGRRSRAWITEARDAIASSIGSQDSSPILFVSSGTEANQAAIRDALEGPLARGERAAWVLSAVEHESVRTMAHWARERGASVRVLPVDSEGRPEVAALGALIDGDTRLVSVIWVNNETGVITDVDGIARIVRERGVPLHLDGAQAWGKLPIGVSRLRGMGVRYLALSGHKIGALPGTGVLWSATGIQEPLLRGKQEGGARGGTENLLGIRSLGIAAAALADKGDGGAGLAAARDRLERTILERIPGALVNGSGAARVGNTLSVSIPGMAGSALVTALDLEGFCVSTGSACSSGVAEPSHVILAMGRAREEAAGTLRISLGAEADPAVLDRFAEALERVVARKAKPVESRPGAEKADG